MANVDPNTPAGVQPTIPGATGYSIMFSDEFASTLDTNKWRLHKDFADFSFPSNWDCNAGGNSLLRVWPDASQNFPNFNMDTHDSFSSWFGVYEIKFKCCRGRGIFPGPLWMIDRNLGGTLMPEIDVMECYGYDGGDWNTNSPLWTPNNGAWTVHRNGGGNQNWDTNERVATLKLDDGNACVATIGLTDLTASFHTLTCLIDATGLIFYWNNVQWGCAVGMPWTQAERDAHPLMTVLDLVFRDAGLPPPDSTNTPSGSGNAMQWDYVRIWSANGSSGGSGGGPVFNAAVSIAPAAGAIIQNIQHLEVAGNLIGNVELVSTATASTTLYGRFTVAATGQSAVLDWNTNNVPNSTRDYRIMAYDVPPGGTPTNQTAAMATRAWTINNVSGSDMPVLTTMDILF